MTHRLDTVNSVQSWNFIFSPWILSPNTWSVTQIKAWDSKLKAN